MNKPLPPKKGVREIDRTRLVEPVLDEEASAAFHEGVELFNAHLFWEAHEAWEAAWRECREESRIFFQGIIQAAAAYHLAVVRKRAVGAGNNFTKALEKLELFPDRFLGLDVGGLRQALSASRAAVERLGPDRLGEFPSHLIPTLTIQS